MTAAEIARLEALLEKRRRVNIASYEDMAIANEIADALPELLKAARDEELLRWMLDDPVSARHLLLLLSEGKGNKESFRNMIRRIITSKDAAMKEASRG